MNPLTFIISITLVVISITPSLARSLPTNSTWEEVWRDAVRKGGILYDQMQSGCFPDKQNPIKFSELLAQGWTVNDKSGPEIQFPPDLTSPFLAGSVKRVLPWTQGDDYYGTSLKHIIIPPPTSLPESRYDNQYSTKKGIINTQILIRRDFEHLYWSDVTFAVWQALSASQKTNIKDLRWIILTEITNSIGTYIIDRACPDGKITTFEPGTEAYRAILGSPNWAIGSVYLLMEHKMQLGHKTIGRIIVLAGEGEEEVLPGPSVVFEILDAPAMRDLGRTCAGIHGLVANA